MNSYLWLGWFMIALFGNMFWYIIASLCGFPRKVFAVVGLTILVPYVQLGTSVLIGVMTIFFTLRHFFKELWSKKEWWDAKTGSM